MITHQNYSRFITYAFRAIQSNNQHATRKPLTLGEFRQVVAHALKHKGPNDLRDHLEKSGGIPLDSTVCKAIALAVQEHGTLPHELWRWPLPPYDKSYGDKNVRLTRNERITAWREALERLRSDGKVDGAWIETYASLDPYIKPAGNGDWFLTSGSEVPLSACEIVLAPSKVTERFADQSIRHEVRDKASKAFYDGLTEFWQQNYAKAYAYFEDAGDHSQALFNRAWLHEDGLGCARDQLAAVALYQRAADMGAFVAHHNLACIYLEGSEAVPANIPLALEHLEKAVALNVAASIGKLGSILWHGYKVEKDEERGRDLLMRAADLGDGPSMNTVGTILAQENGGIATPESIEYYRKAALKAPITGDFSADYNLAFSSLKGNGVPQDLEEARKHFSIAAEAGDADAQHALANLLVTGEAGATDLAEAISWAEKAAAQKHPQALGLLGYLYFEGLGVSEDPERAAEYFRAAHYAGNVGATLFLAKMYEAGVGVDPDDEMVSDLLAHAASMGNAEAQAMLSAFRGEA